MSKISAYTPLTAPVGTDLLAIVDVSDTTMASTGTTKKITLSTIGPATWLPSDNGLLGWTYDMAASASGGSTALATAGTLYVMAIPVRTVISVTNVLILLTANGATLTSGQCFGALYAGAGGSLIGQTADQSTNWGSGATKLVTAALSGGPYTVQPGIVYAAFWFNGTTGPTFFKTSGNSAQSNVNLAAASSRFGTANTTLTTTAPGTLGTIAASPHAYWAALS